MRLTQNTEDEEWASGLKFLKQHRLDYIPFERLKADHQSQSKSSRDFNYDERLAFIDDQLGIDTFDEETRDEAIEASLEAKAVLGASCSRQFFVSLMPSDCISKKRLPTLLR